MLIADGITQFNSYLKSLLMTDGSGVLIGGLGFNCVEYTGTGNQALTNTAQTVIIATPAPDFAPKGTNFTNVGGVVTYTGANAVSVEVSFKVTGIANTNQRSTAYHAVYLNNSEVTRSRTYTYHRVNADGLGSGVDVVRLDLVNGDTIDIRSRENNTADNVTVQRQFCRLSIKEIHV